MNYFIAWLFFFSFTLAADSLQDAKRLYKRLTGANLIESDPLFRPLIDAVEAGNPLEAARVVTGDRKFYSTAVRSWSAPWSSATDLTFQPMDDLQVLAAGLVRDREDFRLFLTGDFFYVADPKYALPLASDSSNAHFEEIENNSLNLPEVLVRRKRANGRNIGVFGSRSFGLAYYSAGTNRRPVKFALEHFLCSKQSRWREASLPDRFVRKDVNRLPSGSLSEYQNECRGCHAPMDAFSGAFAFIDFQYGKLVYSGVVLAKMNSNSMVFPDGYHVNDGHWKNYLAQNQMEDFGWRGPLEGDTLEEFASMLSQSRAFSRCMVQTAIKEVCPKKSSVGFIERLSNHFESNGYDMRSVFEHAVVDSEC